MFKYLCKRICKKMCEKDGFFWMIPAAITAATTVGGAIKHGQDKAQYKKDINQRNRRRVMSAFTGDMPSEQTKPQAPSGISTVLGSALGGFKTGLNIGNLVNPYSYGATPYQAGGTSSAVAQNIVPTTGRVINPYQITYSPMY